MLKKRILASSLASVMALSSVSVVAFADETASFDASKHESVDMGTLKDYVASFDTFLKVDIYEFGTKQADQFQDAIDYAENVISDADSTAEDVTAAYQMLRNVRESMGNKTAAELQALIDENEWRIDTENILNEDLGDHVWDQDKYDVFVGAYYDAEKYVDSGDGRLITDAYIDLENAVKGLKELPSVKKSDFRTAIKDYEAMIKSFSDYEGWRRGTFSVDPKTTGVVLTNYDWAIFDFVKDVVYGNALGAIDITGADADDTVEDFVKGQYERFDAIKTSVKTSDEKIVTAYNAAVDAVAIFKGWKADDTNRAVKANVQDVINKNRANMVFDFKVDFYLDLRDTVPTFEDKNGNTVPVIEIDTAKKTIKALADFDLILDKSTGLMQVNGVTGYYDPTEGANTEKKKIGKGQDIVKYIPVTSDDIQAAWDLQKAYEASVAYLSARVAEAKEVYNFKLLKAAADALVPTPAANHIVADGDLCSLADVNDSKGGAIVTSGPLVYAKYVAGSDTTEDERKAMDKYTAAVEKVVASYNALTKANTGLTAKVASANTTLGTYNDFETEIKAYAETLVVYNDNVADLNAFLQMVKDKKEPKEGVIDEENPGTSDKIADKGSDIAIVAVKTWDGKDITAAKTYKQYKVTNNAGNSDQPDTAEVAAWNAALAKAKTAADNLAKPATNSGSSADVKAEFEDFVEKVVDSIVWEYAANRYETANIYKLKQALLVAEAYLGVTNNDYTTAYTTLEQIVAVTGEAIDELNVVGGKPTGSRSEWTLAYRYLKYALDDLYPATVKSTTYTKKQVEELIEKCYDLAELTGDASVFATNHMNLVEGRKAALEWVAKANADKTYKDGNAVAEYNAEYTLGNKIKANNNVTEATATYVYTELNKLYKKLNDQLARFPVSYGEISDVIGTVGATLEEGAFKSNVDEIKALLKKVSIDLSTLDASDDENEAFTSDREFIAYNRLDTKGSDGEKAFYKDYLALLEAVAKGAEGDEPEFVKGDLNNDGKADPNDAVIVISLFLEGAEYNKAADYNEDGKVDPNDAVAIVEAFLNA